MQRHDCFHQIACSRYRGQWWILRLLNQPWQPSEQAFRVAEAERQSGVQQLGELVRDALGVVRSRLVRRSEEAERRAGGVKAWVLLHLRLLRRELLHVLLRVRVWLQHWVCLWEDVWCWWLKD